MALSSQLTEACGSSAYASILYTCKTDPLMLQDECLSCHNSCSISYSVPTRSQADKNHDQHCGFLEYVDTMLMDETFEDNSWQCVTYTAGDTRNGDEIVASGNPVLSSPVKSRYAEIFRGFRDILDQNVLDSASFKPVEDYSEPNYDIDVEGFHELRDPYDSHFLNGCDLNEIEKNALAEDFACDSLMVEEASGLALKPSMDRDNMLSCENNSDGWDFDGNCNPEGQHVTDHSNSPVADGISLTAVKPIVNKVKDHDGQDISLVENTNLPAELYAQHFDECNSKKKRTLLSLSKEAAKNVQRRGKKDEAHANFVDLKGLLLGSANAVGQGDMKWAMESLQRVQKEGASPHGSGLQRAVYYFSEALMVRISGMGNTFYRAIANTTQLPSPLMMIKAYKMMFEACPYVKIGYHFANQYILKAASGASCLHIIDYGVLYGFQWPCLLYALAHREGGPPFVRITGIEFPPSACDMNPTATTEGTSCRLREYAKTYNVPFEYHAISTSKWEDIDASLLSISENEVLVLNSFNRLDHIHDEAVAHPSPRDQLLKQMLRLKPHLLVMGSMNAGHSSPFFAPRFREAFYYYSNMFDVLHTTIMNDSPERLMFERELMGRAILNVVGCEGTERVELPETYKQWQMRMERVGFQQLPIIPSVWQASKSLMMGYHKDFNLLHESNKWLLVGWRGRTMQAMSAWRPQKIQ